MIIIRILLFPFAVLYDLVTRFRNHLFNIGSKPSFEFDANVIGVGNLSVGGSGKTPMVEYLIRLLKEYKVTTLSRGYGRKSKGFRIANNKDSAITIGDEPLQLFRKFESINVAVGEDRAMAIPEIIHQFPDNEVIVLDDAFQHRYVKPNLNILLTEFNLPFFNDFVMPARRLREARKGARRADVIVVTKCSNDISSANRELYLKEIQKYSDNSAKIFFTNINYVLQLQLVIKWKSDTI